MRTKIFALIFLSLLFTGCKSQTQEGVEVIPPAAFAEKIKSTPNAQLLDVRSPEEYSGPHLIGAENVDWNGSDFEAKAEKLDKAKPVFVYCRVGGRSKKASEKLHEMGFREVYELQGGITKWNEAQLPASNPNN